MEKITCISFTGNWNISFSSSKKRKIVLQRKGFFSYAEPERNKKQHTITMNGIN